MTSSPSFYVILPSNTNVEGNRTNTFRVRLPRKLQFSSEWYVGLAVMVYPHTWPSLGTTSDQFLNVVWTTGESLQITLPSSSFANPQELSGALSKSLQEGSEELVKKVRTAQMSYIQAATSARNRARADYAKTIEDNEKIASTVTHIEQVADLDGAEKLLQERKQRESGKIVQAEPIKLSSEEQLYNQYINEEIAKLDDEDRHILDITKEKGMEAWVHAYRQANFTIRISFDPTKNRFTLLMDRGFIQQVEFSEQLAYILGFDQRVLIKTTTAKFMPDLRGGVSSFYVYTPGLIEPMMIGDVTAPVLRIVTIRGEQDEIIEEQFYSIQYHKLLVKEISEILVEIRATNGALMPFQYGSCTLTLHFKKSPYF